MSISDYFSCTEIGGLAEVTYHSIYFKNYYFKELDGKKHILPSIDIDAITINRPTALSAKDTFFSLLKLYNEICSSSSEDADNAILRWCNSIAHPYNIDRLYDLLVPMDGSVGMFDENTMKLCSFPVLKFKKDLIKLGRHFNFSYALEHLGKNSRIAFELYKEYPEWKEYNYFEPYKKMARKDAGNDEKSLLRAFYRYVAADYESLIHLLVKDFKPQTLQIKLNRETMLPHHTLLVDSVFGIGWFVFSKFITEDALFIDFKDSQYFDDFEPTEDNDYAIKKLTRCLHCGDYIPRSHNRKYCSKDECQAARKRKKSRDCTQRKKEEGRQHYASDLQ